MFQLNDHIIFYGDSITDCGRDRDALPGEPRGWGHGYAAMTAEFLRAQNPELGLQFTNKGVGGNRVYDLEERLETDVLALRPDFVSILIGINDVWRRYDSGVVSPLDEFEACYERILQRLTAAGCEVLLLEPFVLPVPPDRQKWREDLDPKIEVIHQLADTFALQVVPLDEIFENAARQREAKFWAADGVHPSEAGHALISQAWIEAVG